jgi:hypothetical protein
MAYAHDWSRVETPAGPLPSEPRDAYGRLTLDTLAIVGAGVRPAEAPSPWVAADGGRGRDLAQRHPTGSRETFAWPAHPGEPWWTDTPGHRWWDACTTNRQPYDLILCSVLIRVGTHYRPTVRISSDGGWGRVVIDGRWWPEWIPAR